MSYPWTVYKTWTTGEILTASDLNSSFTQPINNSICTSINDYSNDVATMQTQSDPYPGSSESLATTLAGELERLRYTLKGITGKTYWYYPPDLTLANIYNGSTTFSGTKTFLGDVSLGNPSNTAFRLQASLSGDILGLFVDNQSNTASSHSRLALRVAGDSSGDAYTLYQVVAGAGTRWATGVHNSDSDKYKVSNSANLGTNDYLTIDTSGNVGVPVGSLTLSPTSNQLVLGATRTVTVTAPTPASSSRTWTIPDITGNGTFAALEGTQTFTGAKTFNGAVTFGSTVSGITLASSLPIYDGATSGTYLTFGNTSGDKSSLKRQHNASAVSTTVPILSAGTQLFAHVTGSYFDGASTHSFSDSIVTGVDTVTVLGSATKNSPAARTYSIVAGALNLAMAANAYDTQVVAIQP